MPTRIGLRAEATAGTAARTTRARRRTRFITTGTWRIYPELRVSAPTCPPADRSAPRLSGEKPRVLRDTIAWVNRRGSLSTLVRSLRETLPGDPRFGDPMSTTAPEPAQVLARRAWGAPTGASARSPSWGWP